MVGSSKHDKRSDDGNREMESVLCGKGRKCKSEWKWKGVHSVHSNTSNSTVDECDNSSSKVGFHQERGPERKGEERLDEMAEAIER